MALSVRDRKAELVRLGLTYAAIAERCDVTATTVGNVVGGRKLNGPGATRVMEYLADRIGAPVEMVFPVVRINQLVARESGTPEQRDGADRRRFANPHAERRDGERRGGGLKSA